MNSKLSEKEKVTAYILNKELGYSQGDIAILMATKQPDKKMSQPTIANAVKESGYKLQINKLQKQYLEAKQELYELGFRERPNLIENASNIIEIDPDGPSFFDK